jgi:hypothetical protein
MSGEAFLFQSQESAMGHAVTTSDILQIIEGEFEEMPGMRLTGPQFRRLFALQPTECEEVTTALINSGILAVDARGQFCRRTDLHE